MKLVVVGAGSSYTPELIQGVIDHIHELPFTEIALMDIDAEAAGDSERADAADAAPRQRAGADRLIRERDGDDRSCGRAGRPRPLSTA